MNLQGEVLTPVLGGGGLPSPRMAGVDLPERGREVDDDDDKDKKKDGDGVDGEDRVGDLPV